MLLIPIQALDADEFLLNTPSFTYDLRQGMAGRRNHRPEDYITKCTAVDPGEEGETVWQQALGEFFTGDQELIDYAQEICGLMAIGKVYVEAGHRLWRWTEREIYVLELHRPGAG